MEHKVQPSSNCGEFQRSSLSLSPVIPFILQCKEGGPQLQLNHTVDSLLETIQKPVAVVTVCGPCQEGKLQFISQTVGVDPSSYEEYLTTKEAGVWMVTTVLQCDKFALIILFTTDGEQANSVDIFVAATLLSSFMVHCSEKLPEFAEVRYFTELTRSIIIYDRTDTDDLCSHLPQLLLVTHNTSIETRHTPFLLREINVIAGSRQSPLAAIKVILDLFPRTECLIPPHSSHEHPDTRDSTVADYILKHISPKESSCVAASSEVDGLTVAIFAEQCIEAINSKGCVQLSYTWEKVMILKQTVILQKQLKSVEEENRRKDQQIQDIMCRILSESLPGKLNYKKLPYNRREELYHNATPLKLIVLGDFGVGKTSLIKVFTDGPFPEDQYQWCVSPTKENEKCLMIETNRGDHVRLEIWDTAGQERNASLVAQYFHDVQAVLLIYDATSLPTLKNIKSKWLPLVNDRLPPDIIKILVSTKNDCILDGPRSVLPDMGRRYAKELDTELYETSCSTTLCTHDIIDQVFFAAVHKFRKIRKTQEEPPNPQAGIEASFHLPQQDGPQLQPREKCTCS